MQKKVATFNVTSFVLAFFCLVIALSASIAKADYRIVYPHAVPPPVKVTPASGSNNDIWQTFRTEFSLDHQANRAEVKGQIAWFMAHRKYLYAAAKNARPYMYYIIQQIKKRKLPVEFALLPIIESAYDPFAYSTAGAAGLWQMMPATATDFRLKQTWWYDGRRDIVASTNAALDYLVYLENFFNGNWLFVVYAYHSGQGTVLKAIKKNSDLGESTDFWSLPLGKQAQIYVPKLLALAEMIGHPEKYPLDMPKIPDKPYLTEVDVGSQIDLTKAAKLSGLSLGELKNLNPGFNRWATAPDGPYRLLIPIQNEVQLRDGLALLPQGNRVTWERYDVKSGDTLSKIATKFHTTTALLQELNKLDNTALQIGDVLFIPNSLTHVSPKRIPVAEATKPQSVVLVKASSPVLQEAEAAVRSVKKLEVEHVAPAPVIYRVVQGDTANNIAQRFGLRWESIKIFNHLSTDILTIGQDLSIPPVPIASESPAKSASKQVRYTVKAGDNLFKIAMKFTVSVDDLKRSNPSLAKNPTLHPGKTLIIDK